MVAECTKIVCVPSGNKRKAPNQLTSQHLCDVKNQADEIPSCDLMFVLSVLRSHKAIKESESKTTKLYTETSRAFRLKSTQNSSKIENGCGKL